MTEKDHIQKELNELAPRLSKLKKETPFKVPVDYFSSLEGSVMSKLGKEAKPIKEIEESWLSRLSRWIDVAIWSLAKPKVMLPAFAIIAVVFIGVPFFLTDSIDDAIAPVTFAEISDAEMEEYLFSNASEMDYLMLLEDMELNEMKSEGKLLDDWTDDEVEAYLLEYIDDPFITEDYL